MSKNWLLYGANGYTGKIVIEEVKKLGFNLPIIAGRNRDEIESLAKTNNLKFRVFSIENLDEGLKDIDIVMNCAGPFIKTIDAFIDACLRNNVHYFDITGEIDVFQKSHEAHTKFEEQNLVICPGVGFDVVPTDCVALMLKENFSSQGQFLEIGFRSKGGVSKGTRKTALLGGRSGSKIRRNGDIKTVKYGEIQKRIAFPDKEYQCTAISWGDVFTAYITTGIPNITVYVPLPRTVKRYGKFSFLLRFKLFRMIAKKFFFKSTFPKNTDGPPKQVREETNSYVWGKIQSNNGDSMEMTIETPNGYTLTALTVIHSINKFLEMGEFKGGFYTPSLLFGSKFIFEIDGVKEIDMNP